MRRGVYVDKGNFNPTFFIGGIMNSEKEKFIQQHAEQIIPVLDDGEEKDRVKQYFKETAEHPGGIADFALTKEQTDKTLEQFETKVFLCEKPGKEHNPDAKRVLLTASEQLAFNTMLPIIAALKSDRRCKAIELLTDSLAGKQFEKLSDASFKRVDDKSLPVLIDALKPAEKEPFDVAITAVERLDTPNEVALFGGKSVFGAKKLYFLSSGWGGVGGSMELFGSERGKHMDKIDGFFCADKLAKRILLRQLPDLPEDKIFLTGVPATDGLELHKGGEHREKGRIRLGLSNNDLVVLYLGDISVDYKKIVPTANPRINEETFNQTRDAIVRLAKEQPEKHIVLAVRPHPVDPNKEELLKPYSQSLPPNLKIVPAQREVISMQEAAYGADIIISIVSTENFLAPLRGKKAVFLGYKESGLGDKVLEKVYGRELMEIIGQDENIVIVSSPDELTAELKEYGRAERKEEKIPKPPEVTSVDKILDIALGK